MYNIVQSQKRPFSGIYKKKKCIFKEKKKKSLLPCLKEYEFNVMTHLIACNKNGALLAKIIF